MGIVCPAGVRARIERSCWQVIHVAAFDLDGTILDGESPLKLTTSLLRHRELPLHKGVSFMENKAGWHGKAPNDEEYAIAMDELEKAGEALCQK